MKKNKFKLFMVILLIVISGGAAINLLAQEKNLDVQFWYHWSPGFCHTVTPTGTSVTIRCDTPDPFGPCIVETSCDGPVGPNS